LVKAAARTDDEISLHASLLATTAHHADTLVDFVRKMGVAILPAWFDHPPHMQSPPWSALSTLSSNVHVHARWQASRHAEVSRALCEDDVLPRRGGIWFDLTVNEGQPLSPDYRVQWRVTNTGAMALSLRVGRGEFYAPTSGNRRWEELSYRGVHIVEAFVLRRRDDVLVAKSPPFHVVIE